MSNRDRKNGVPTTVTSIPLVDPHAVSANASIGELVRDATTQMSTLVRAEVELAKAEITRDVKKGLTGSVFFILALVVLLYSTFFMFLFLAELLDTWLWRWAAFLIVFVLMLVVTAVLALLGFLKVRRIRGPKQAIESVKETTAALTPGLAKFKGTAPVASAPALTAPAPAPAPSKPRTPERTPARAERAERAVHAPIAPAAVAYEEAVTEAVTYEEPVTYEEAVVYEEPVTYSEPVTYEEAVVYEEPVTYEEAVVYEEPVTYSEPVSYEQVVVYEEPVTYSEPVYESSVTYEESAESTASVSYQAEETQHDPTTAIFADPDTPGTIDHDRLPRDPSGR